MTRTGPSRRRTPAGIRRIAQGHRLRDPRTFADTDGQPDGYQEYLEALREEVVAFGKPVVYVHGDSHYFRTDKPFLDSHAGSKTSRDLKPLETIKAMATTMFTGSRSS